MILVTTYKVRPFLTKEETAELMGVFANVGVPDGTLSHYVAVDASHGVVTVDTDDVAGVYRNILNYTQWIEYEINVMLTVDDAVPHILDTLA